MTTSLHQATVHVRLRLQAATLDRLERTRKAYCQHALAMVEMAINQGYHGAYGVRVIADAWKRVGKRQFAELDVRLHEVTVERLGSLMASAQERFYARCGKHAVHFDDPLTEQYWTLHACAVDALLLHYLKHLPQPKVTPLSIATVLPWKTFRDRDKEAHAKAKARTLEEVLRLTPDA